MSYDDTVEMRIVALERRNRFLSIAVCANVIVLSTILLMGADEQVPATVEARERFVVRDSNGRVSAALGAKGLVLLSGRTPRGAFMVTDDSAGLAITDANGKERIGLTLDAEGPAVVLRDQTGRGRIGLGLSASGSVLSLSYADGTKAVQLAGSPIGPTLLLNDSVGRLRAALSVVNEEPSLDLLDSSGKSIFTKP